MTPPAAAAAGAAPARQRTGAPQRRRPAPPRPRRVSGPTRPTPPARRPAGSAAGGAHGSTGTALGFERGLAPGALALAERLAGARALDRLIRGRVWIGLIAFALIGIVLLQLLVLQLNASIGRALVREGALQRENATLSIEGSELASGERVESQAEHLGMQLVPIGSLLFLGSNARADVQRAARALDVPVHSATSSTESASNANAGSGAAGSGASAEQAAGATTTSAGAQPGAGNGEAGATPASGEAESGAQGAATSGASPTTGASPSQSTPQAPPSGETPANVAAAPVGAGGGVGASLAGGSG